MPRASKSRSWLLGVIALVAVGFALYVTRPVIVLVAVAMFLSILLAPVARMLNRVMPTALGLVVIFTGIGGVLTGLGVAVFVEFRDVGAKLPHYADRFEEMAQIGLDLAAQLGLDLTWDDIGTKDAIAEAFGFVTSGLESIFGVLFQLLLVLIMVTFMLLEAPTMKAKISKAFDAERRDKVIASLDSMTRKIQRYVVTKTVVSLITGLLTALITAAFGLDFPFVWGLIAFQLNFIPNLGSIIAVFPPTMVALLQFEQPTIAVVIFFTLGSLQFTIGNLIEPRIMGRTLELSPTIVFISMLFWGFFWGFWGVVLAVPLTAVAKIVCEHVNSLRPIAVLLGAPEQAPRKGPA